MSQPRPARLTLRAIDEYCEHYRNLFSDVRSFEAFKYLHVGMLSDLKRKTLPNIAKCTGLDNYQGLHHFVAHSPWSLQDFLDKKNQLLLQFINGREIELIVDETGDQKKGNTTDYVARQYIGKLGKIENGIVAVVIYGVLDGIVFPISFRVFKHQSRLKEGDVYQTKPEMAAEMVEEILEMGFQVKRVLADSLYGRSECNFVSTLERLNLKYMLSIPEDYGVWLPKEQKVRVLKWRKFKRTLHDGEQEQRYVREVVYGKRGQRRYWELTTDPDTLPKNSTSFVMTNDSKLKYSKVGDIYGGRNWVEYGIKQTKSEFGWADFRFTDYHHIERWWALVCSAYTMVSLYQLASSGEENQEENAQHDNCGKSEAKKEITDQMSQHPHWQTGKGWKNKLNQLRLILQPWCVANIIRPWLEVFSLPNIPEELICLQRLMDCFPGPISKGGGKQDYHFSSG